MPFIVDGWLEYNFAPSSERDVHSTWQLLALGPLRSEATRSPAIYSGSRKSAPLEALFHERGIPEDCCVQVTSDVERNEQFIARYSEGDFGHT